MATPQSRKQLSDIALVERVQSIFINAAEGRRSVGDDAEYTQLSKELRRRKLGQPTMVKTHPTVDSFVAAIKGTPDRRERVQRIRGDFGPVLLSLIALDTDDVDVDASAWTGQPTHVARLKIVRTLLPLAQSSVESMIVSLSEPNPNGGPLLDERVEALDHLRNLHRTLGEYLAAVEAGHLEDDLGQGLAAEAARYAKRTARALRNDPMPYLSSSLLLGIFYACGMTDIGGYLGSVALTIQKHAGK